MTLTVFKTLKIGGVPTKKLENKVKKSCEEVTRWVKGIMKQKDFVTAETQTDVNFVVLTPTELGFTSDPRTYDFMTKNFCAEWSAKHLEGYVIELCEAEDGPQLRIQYEDQPNGEVLWMAMERITDSEDHPSLFAVERSPDGKRWLRTGRVGPDHVSDLDDRVMFRFRKLPEHSAYG
jgi:hypothetical protein